MAMKKMWSSLIFSAALMQGCMPYRSIRGPMNLVNDNLNCSARPATLIVLLPGAYDTPQDFIDQGFVTAVRARGIKADIQLVDAHMGYYTNQQIVQRLEDEVVTPAKTNGYQKIWFVGISLGGYGTLLYSMNKPGVLEGFFIMAPYMGPRDIPAKIQEQGGLKNWSTDVQDNADINLWRWLKGYATNTPGLAPAYLGYGASDRFAQANGVLAGVLPEGRSQVIPGGHDWVTWQRLWGNFLDKAPLPKIESASTQCNAG
jgi:pimeloyl-ACP methyl ester carboxylesterase